MCFDYVVNLCDPDNSEADEQQKHAEPQVQSNVMSYTGIALPNMNYATSTQLGAENAVVLFETKVFLY